MAANRIAQVLGGGILGHGRDQRRRHGDGMAAVLAVARHQSIGKPGALLGSARRHRGADHVGQRGDGLGLHDRMIDGQQQHGFGPGVERVLETDPRGAIHALAPFGVLDEMDLEPLCAVTMRGLEVLLQLPALDQRGEFLLHRLTDAGGTAARGRETLAAGACRAGRPEGRPCFSMR